jgi:hypothetical protein
MRGGETSPDSQGEQGYGGCDGAAASAALACEQYARGHGFIPLWL